MAKKKFIAADSGSSFRPEDMITRGEFCDFLVRLNGLTGDAESAFSDIDGHRYEEQISLVSEHGWINGYEDGTFKPDGYITRAEITAIVCRMESRTDNGGAAAFSDVSDAHWAYEYISEVAEGHYVN